MSYAVLPGGKFVFIIWEPKSRMNKRDDDKLDKHSHQSTYRFIINSHIPLSVNFFCGDCRIAIVTVSDKNLFN